MDSVYAAVYRWRKGRLHVEGAKNEFVRLKKLFFTLILLINSHTSCMFYVYIWGKVMLGGFLATAVCYVLRLWVKEMSSSCGG
jgi:asparagine N-glycosylation enzyme membrane subunit Stt3